MRPIRTPALLARRGSQSQRAAARRHEMQGHRSPKGALSVVFVPQAPRSRVPLGPSPFKRAQERGDEKIDVEVANDGAAEYGVGAS